MTDDVIVRRNELYRRLEGQVKLLRKLQDEQQSASPAQREQYDRDIRLVSGEVRRLNAELERLKDE